ncbi:MAG: penicillin-binding protein 2 [Candidatus Moranbacteria bacterium]|nr:penicillin-binding protein 2 [Candidatus Moranbacteria bacterium]
MRIKQRDSYEIDDEILTLTEEEVSRMEKSLSKNYFNFFWIAVICVTIVLVGRIAFLTVAKGEYYTQIAERNSIRAETIPAPRGRIYDNEGVALVHNIPSTDIIIDRRKALNTEETKIEVVEKVAKIINVPEKEKIIQQIQNGLQSNILIKENITQEESLLLAEKQDEIPEITMVKNATRQYTDSTIFSHIIGYVGKVSEEEMGDKEDAYLSIDYIGKSGLEKSYDAILRGTHGAKRFEVTATGQTNKEIEKINPITGKDIFLNIDHGLQKKLFDRVVEETEKVGIKTAAAVAIDPKNGAVRALVSLPSYDNNLFSTGRKTENYQRLFNDEMYPLFNRVIAGEYPPASTIKMAIAAAALEEKIITPETIIESRGGLQVGEYFFGDWKTHGKTDLRQAIAVSSDVYFYTVGGGYGNIEGLGISRIKKYEEEFGLGAKTGIDLSGEAEGFIPTKEWKEEKIQERWYVGNTYHASIGQGYMKTTPIQIANYIAAIANGGTVYKPQLLSHTKDAESLVEYNEPEILKKVSVKKETLEILREGMRQTVTNGTATMLNAIEQPIAGKTGTGQFGGQDEKTHSWFASFAPYDNPELVLVILMEGQPAKVSSSTVPIAKDVWEWYFDQRKGVTTNGDEM